MSEPATHTHLSIDYIELATNNMEASKQFFSKAFGWQFTDYGPEYAGFKDTRPGEAEAGGLRYESKVAMGGPLIVLFSTKLDETRQAVLDAGGTLTKDIFDFPGGRRFQFSDPAGNELGVWSER